MEVHSHTHTPRKKWTHYFWEFLMLFLAVFCGFLAENKREHMIEHQREKKYIQSLVTDLKGDTTEIQSVIEFNIARFHGMDTLIAALSKQVKNEEDEKELYNLNRRYALNIYTMIFNDRTIRQLLSSGNMRLIKRQAISDSIMNYYGQPKDNIIMHEKVYEEVSKRLLFFGEDIFDGLVFAIKLKSDNSFYRDVKEEKMKLITREKTILKKYAQMILSAQSMLAVYLEMLFNMRSRAESLLFFLTQEYHLK